MRPKRLIVLILVPIAITIGIFSGISEANKQVFIFQSYNFNEDYWILKHGSEMDSFAYIIDDRRQLNDIKSHVLMKKSDEQFATTGGYSFELYKNGESVLITDLIPDKGFTKSGKLMCSGQGTLEYRNLNWLTNSRFTWKKVKCVPISFSSEKAMQIFEDSLYEIGSIRSIDEYRDHERIHVTYLIEQ